MAILHWCILIGGVLALIASSTDLRRFVLAVIFTLPFNGVFIEAGQRIELFKIACLLALPVAACHLPRLAATGPLGGFGIFASWATWMTLMTFYFPPDYLANQGDGMRSLGLRLALQGTLLLSRLSLVGLCLVALQRSVDVTAALRTWVAATTVLAGFGLVEQACHLIGYDVGGVFYDGLLNGQPTHLTYSVFGIDFKRVGSFAHEPKMLARWLVPSIVVLLSDIASGTGSMGRASRTRMLLAVHLAALAFTFSTSGYLMLVASLIVPLLAIGSVSVASARYLAALGGAAVVVCLGGLGVGTLFESVIAEKSAKYGGFIQGGSDGPAFAFLEAYPWAALWGSGLATQGFYLPEFITDDFEYVYENVAARGFGGFGVESGWLSLLLDTGAVGIAALLFPVVARWMSGTVLIRRLLRRPDEAGPCAALMLTRSLLAACLIGMIAYPLEGVGLLAVSVGMASAAVATAGRRLAAAEARKPGIIAARVGRRLATGACA
jgi:hypothetical protein